MQKKIDSQKNYIKYRDKEIQGRMTFLQKSSESFDTEFVKLVKQAEDSNFLFFFLLSIVNPLKPKMKNNKVNIKS